MENNVSKNEILEAINDFSSRVDERFDKLEGKVDKLEGKVDKLEGKVDGFEGRVGKIEATMVTKDYLDEKMADLRGDLVVLMRKEDTKVSKLIEILKRRKVITEIEEKEILSMEPFAKLFI
ncbi:MAG: hypothetical protein PHR36_05240 [Patescibacteria group bacterium]|nr:hypothetical protein [Patescibacteria group bacterium]